MSKRNPEDWDSEDEDPYNNDGLVKVEDTKLVMKKSLFKFNKKRKRMSSDEMANPGFYAALDQGIEIRNPRKKKGAVEVGEKRPVGRPRKKRRPSDDYLSHRPTQKRERLRADPLVSITTMFEGIITEMKDCVEGKE